ncbi:hypothetical protein NQ317_018065 [Molorchus minor]|uniref:Uncharacterized protein n=1 Tax=Molorchus minor TaxID=1323400 RepID=A0ABQ9JHW5_9CUCU|nr:hypothetical protein NQ317_018065 [Molorchus minor]
MAEASYSEFVKSVERSLKLGDTSHVLQAFTDEKNCLVLKYNAWDLIHIITEYLTTYHKIHNLEQFNSCKELINIITFHSTPDDVLLQFIEELEETEDDTNSFGWALNAIQQYLIRCDVPEDANLIGKEKMLLDCDETTQQIIKLYSGVLPFYESLIENFKTSSEDPQDHISVICKFLIQLLGKPIVCLDMEVFDGIKKIIAETLVHTIFQVLKDPVQLLKIRFGNVKDNDLSPSGLGIAVLFYLIYSENVCIEQVPKVYDPIYFSNTVYILLIHC